MNRWFGFAVLPLALAACTEGSQGPSDPPAPQRSRAMDAWHPGSGDSCPISVHDRYSTVGPDGKLYPTWHPAVDPATGCTFGHEHGRDPAGSVLFAASGPIPFGYANETLDQFDPSLSRHEDHVGHKIEWENGLTMRVDSVPIATRCDVLTKLHQGTHSKDAFTNNLHEIVYHLKCTDGSELHVTMMSAIGRPGEFVRTCDREAHVMAGQATPAGSPIGNGKRVIADRGCVDQFILVTPGQPSMFNSGLRESWQTSNTIRLPSGKPLAHFNPYFQVVAPSRFYDPSRGDLTGRSIDLCYEVEANGDRARGGGCLVATSNGAVPGITYDDPRSTFNGVARVVDINTNLIYNTTGNEVWYTDPFGKNASPTAFPGSIRQLIGKLDNTAIRFTGPVIGVGRQYGGPGVHAPN